MNGKNEQFDEDLGLKVSPEFKRDLSNLFESRRSIPPEVDRAILDGACVKLIRRQRRRKIVRRIGTITAAAAVIIIAFNLDIARRSQPHAPATVAVSQSYDIDQSGRVDILDAFKLARQIQAADNADNSELISSLRKQGFDMNGDGLVNRDDVDFVARAAVHLDKGVL